MVQVIGRSRAEVLLGRTQLLGIIATTIFTVVFAVLWLPYYLVRSEGQLVLYPIALFLALIITGLAFAGFIAGAEGVSLSDRGSPVRRSALCWLAVNATLTVVPFPAIWFGNTPILLLGG